MRMSDASEQLRTVLTTSKPDIRLIIIYKFISYHIENPMFPLQRKTGGFCLRIQFVLVTKVVENKKIYFVCKVSSFNINSAVRIFTTKL